MALSAEEQKLVERSQNGEFSSKLYLAIAKSKEAAVQEQRFEDATFLDVAKKKVWEKVRCMMVIHREVEVSTGNIAVFEIHLKGAGKAHSFTIQTESELQWFWKGMRCMSLLPLVDLEIPNLGETQMFDL